MNGPVFVDTNVLIYAHDSDAGKKRLKAGAVLKELWGSGAGRLSTQVLLEFYVNVTRKIPAPLSAAAAREVIRNYVPWVESPITPATVLRAFEIGETWNVSFWDAMIVASAEQSRSAELYSEDLAHGLVIAGVRVVNPLL